MATSCLDPFGVGHLVQAGSCQLDVSPKFLDTISFGHACTLAGGLGSGPHSSAPSLLARMPYATQDRVASGGWSLHRPPLVLPGLWSSMCEHGEARRAHATSHFASWGAMPVSGSEGFAMRSRRQD